MAQRKMGVSKLMIYLYYEQEYAKPLIYQFSPTVDHIHPHHTRVKANPDAITYEWLPPTGGNKYTSKVKSYFGYAFT